MESPSRNNRSRGRTEAGPHGRYPFGAAFGKKLCDTRGKLDPIRLKDGRAGTFFHLPSIVPPDRYKMTKELTKKLQNLARKKCWPIIL